MPSSMTGLMTTVLLGNPGWFAKGVGDATLQAGNAPITPRDPSTLTLALIGAGTLALYFVAKRKIRTRENSAATNVRLVESRRPDGGANETPSRDAA